MAGALVAQTATTFTQLSPGNLSLTPANAAQRRPWDRPEFSIGAYCGYISRTSRQKCWDVKERSPPQMIWNEIKVPIGELIKKEYEHLDAKGEDVFVKMFMVGADERTCNPTVLVCCAVKSLRQRVLSLIASRRILSMYRGVVSAGCSRRPQHLGGIGNAQASSYSLPRGIYAMSTSKSLEQAMPVAVVVNDGGAPRKATLGGTIVVGGRYYGLMTGHVFDQEVADEIDDASSDFEFFDPDDDSEAGNEKVFSQKTSLGSVTSTEDEQLLADDAKGASRSQIGDVAFFDQHRWVRINESEQEKYQWDSYEPDDWYSYVPDNEVTVFGPRIGIRKEIIRSRGSNWALVALDDHWQSLVRIDAASGTQTGSEDVALKNASLEVTSENWRPETTSDRPSQSPVYIFTGRSPKPFEGTLSAMTSLLITKHCETPQELWEVRLQGNTFAHGDCGSWVIDQKSGKLHGLIALGHPGTGIPDSPEARVGYLLPASNIFAEIQHETGLHSHLPSRAQYSIAPPKPNLVLQSSEVAGSGEVMQELNSHPRDPRTILVLELGAAQTQITCVQTAEEMAQLLPFKRAEEMPVRWIILWDVNHQLEALDQIASYYCISNTLIGEMQAFYPASIGTSEKKDLQPVPIGDKRLDAAGRVVRSQIVAEKYDDAANVGEQYHTQTGSRYVCITDRTSRNQEPVKPSWTFLGDDSTVITVYKGMDTKYERTNLINNFVRELAEFRFGATGATQFIRHQITSKDGGKAGAETLFFESFNSKIPVARSSALQCSIDVAVMAKEIMAPEFGRNPLSVERWKVGIDRLERQLQELRVSFDAHESLIKMLTRNEASSDQDGTSVKRTEETGSSINQHLNLTPEVVYHIQEVERETKRVNRDQIVRSLEDLDYFKSLLETRMVQAQANMTERQKEKAPDVLSGYRPGAFPGPSKPDVLGMMPHSQAIGTDEQKSEAKGSSWSSRFKQVGKDTLKSLRGAKG